MQDFFNQHYAIISDRVKQLRHDKKLSQEKFAEKIDCSREYISRVENYKEHVSLQFILTASFVFNVNPEYFFHK